MPNIKVQIGLKAYGEANSFLRALWAELRQEFGSLSCAFSPNRIGRSKTISFGEVQLGKSDILHVCIGYITKGSLDYIVFSDNRSISLRGKGSDPQVFATVERCIHAALKNFRCPRTYNLSTALMLNTAQNFFAYSEFLCVQGRLGSDPTYWTWSY
jgi:hypothetical protein